MGLSGTWGCCAQKVQRCEGIEKGNIKNGDIEHGDIEHGDIEYGDVYHEDVKRTIYMGTSLRYEVWGCQEDINMGTSLGMLSTVTLQPSPPDVQRGNIKNRNIEHGDVEHGDIEHRDVKHGGIDHEYVKHSDIECYNRPQKLGVAGDWGEHVMTQCIRERSVVQASVHWHGVHVGSDGLSELPLHLQSSGFEEEQINNHGLSCQYWGEWMDMSWWCLSNFKGHERRRKICVGARDLRMSIQNYHATLTHTVTCQVDIGYLLWQGEILPACHYAQETYIPESPSEGRRSTMQYHGTM
ncbi:hypothetical protein BDQ17DRAFT_1328248 [Cyathus striatus]|nr:hypothetical protein BDQ17DRAFT_1328248 [Cyathus striatus]